MSIFDSKSVLVTGGTGSFGRRFVKTLLKNTSCPRIVVYSRDELKQYEFSQELGHDPRMRFFIGDVRDLPRLERALHGVQLVIHAAALKQVPAAEYNPFEAVKTNVHGAQNIIDACISNEVERVIALSTDKASSPLNLYGATKFLSDKLFVAGNAYSGKRYTRFGVVRYGNVLGSRGSVLPFFRKMAPTGTIPITDERMTRFWITLEQGVQFVFDSMERLAGGEIFIPKIPSMKILDLAEAIAPGVNTKVVGIRPGEKLHEEMISEDASRHGYDMGDHYVLCPDFPWWDQGHVSAGKPLPDGFCYSSATNSDWLDVDGLRRLLEETGL